MDKKEFQEFCKNEFYRRGFKKVKKMYYLDGDKDLLCGIDLQKSYYGSCYYVNVNFFIKGFNPNLPYPTYYDVDIFSRILVMSKNLDKGEYYRTGQIEYEKYKESELRVYFDKAFDEWILPCIYEGTGYFVRLFNKPALKYGFDINPLREELILEFLNIRKDWRKAFQQVSVQKGSETEN